MNRLYIKFLCLFLLFSFLPSSVQAIDEKNIPSQLKSWKSWVLHGKEDYMCPNPYNNGNEYLCIWPSRLKMELDGRGGRFTQEWIIYSEGWVPLSGNKNAWPYEVAVDKVKVPVTNRNGVPSIRLEKGNHTVKGVFKWNNMPEMINVPLKTGLVELKVNNKPVESPLLDAAGRLWFQNKRVTETTEDKSDIKVFRMLDDNIPMIITTLARLWVSGQAREIKLDDLLPGNFIPMELKSPLPVLINQKREVVVQARPGIWDIYITARSKNSVNNIGPVKTVFGQETWVIKKQNHLRMIKISGVQAIDPGQTDLPRDWKSYPAYIVNNGDEIILEQIKRGDPSPAPDQLQLHRIIWLDFNGKGYTFKDRINGTMSRQWFLVMDPPAKLGRVTLDGVDQLITSHEKENKPGVELRKGVLNLEGESRLESGIRAIPAVGWDHNVQSLSGRLNLPPGWKLMTVKGVDSIKGTWLQNWTLLDLFLVLVISMAVFKMWNIRAGILALVTLALIYHEPSSPRTVWIHLLAATALLRYIPEGWIRKLVSLWRVIAIIALIIITIPFMLKQVRTGLYPQLERISNYSRYDRPALNLISQKRVMRPYENREIRQAELQKAQIAPFELDEVTVTASRGDKAFYGGSRNVMLQDPNALIQTGPGLPQWQWHSYDMQWNGPVESNQEIRLWLISPAMNCILAFLRIILLAFLVLFIMDLKSFQIKALKTAVPILLFLMVSAPFSDMANASEQDGFPPETMLRELQGRLLEKDDCFPYCADSPNMLMTLDNNNVRIVFRVNASVETAVPLPGSSILWNPENIYIGSKSADTLYRDRKGTLWVLVPKGIHNIILQGKAPHVNEFQIPLPMIPHSVNLEVKGWSVHGVDREGRVQGSIKLIRLDQKSKKGQDKKEQKEIDKGVAQLQPFFHIERIVSLGIEWKLLTTVTRVTPANDPVVVTIPLVRGESVITGGIKVENDKTVLSMSPGETEKRWVSTLETASEISLTADESSEWTETWILDASPIWHCEFSGIPLIHHQDNTGQWRPEWKPWPGESIVLKISRPKAIPGKIITVESANLNHTPGIRTSSSKLSMTLRSSQGGQQKIQLPDGASLRQVKIDNRSQPINQQDKNVTIPLNPGTQTVSLEWQQGTGSQMMTVTPEVSIGAEAVNSNITFNIPKNRWVLFVKGPLMGPAVLFWSYLMVIVLAGVILGRIKWTPLGTASWILMGVGLTQVPAPTAILIAGWFLAMGIRKKAVSAEKAWVYNLVQVLLTIWFVGAMSGLWSSIERGLLGIPNMQIAGNGSSDFILKWTQDRITSDLPSVSVISVHIFIFKALMLLWALWLSYSLILKWLPWAWGCFNEGGIYRKSRKKDTKEKDDLISKPDEENNNEPDPDEKL
ncbi:hypothetical protein ACFL1N_12655 [Thermodesulfobacteriota bacterium]